MGSKLLDIYSDYLICQNKYATATGLSDLLSGDISHDKITKYLNSADLGSKELWEYTKPEIRKHQTDKGGVLILDDSIEEKPYTDENEIVAWHHSHAKEDMSKASIFYHAWCHIKMWYYPLDMRLSIRIRVFRHETRKVKRKSSTSKNEHFRNLIQQSLDNKVMFEHILADNWFGSKENMEFIDKLGKKIYYWHKIK